MKVFFLLLASCAALPALAGPFPKHHSKACHHAKQVHYQKPRHHGVGFSR